MSFYVALFVRLRFDPSGTFNILKQQLNFVLKLLNLVQSRWKDDEFKRYEF